MHWTFSGFHNLLDFFSRNVNLGKINNLFYIKSKCIMMNLVPIYMLFIIFKNLLNDTKNLRISKGLKNSALISRLTFFKEERKLSFRLKFNDEIKVCFYTNYFFTSLLFTKLKVAQKNSWIDQSCKQIEKCITFAQIWYKFLPTPSLSR